MNYISATMAIFKVGKIQRALNGKLRATEDHDRRHITYRVFDKDGMFLGETYISHSHTEIGDPLLGQMAKQLNIGLALWRDIIKCPKNREDYVREAR